LQWGLMQRLERAEGLRSGSGWQRLGQRRERAQRRAMDDDEVGALCSEVLTVAAEGLGSEERPLLDYAFHVLETRRCAAGRLLDSWRSAPGVDAAARLAHVARRHCLRLDCGFVDRAG